MKTKFRRRVMAWWRRNRQIAVGPQALFVIGALRLAGIVLGVALQDPVLLAAVAASPARPAPQKKRVAIYLRASTEESNQPWTIQAQREALAAYAKSQGWVIVAEYMDRSSGANLNRPGLQDMLVAVRRQEFDAVLVYRVDRLSRRLIDTAQMAEELEQCGVSFVSATEPFDSSNPFGRFVLKLLAMFAEFEREMIVDRIREGVQARRSEGKLVGGLPTGMALDENGVPVGDPAWLPMIVDAMEMYANDNLGSTTIAKRLTAKGWTSKSGRRLSGKSVLSWLQSPAFVGMRRDEAGSLVPADWEAVVDRALWDRVQVILAERGEHPWLRRGNVTDYVLAHLGRCKRCGSAYVGKSANGNGGRYDYYICQTRNRLGKDGCDNDPLPREDYEAAVLEQLLTLLVDTDLLTSAFDEALANNRKSLRDVESDLARLKRKRALIDQRLARYFDAFETGTMDAKLCNKRVAELTDEGDLADTHIMACEARLTGNDVSFPTEAIEAASEQLNAFFDGAKTEPLSEEESATAKALLRLLIKEISINGRDDIRVTYRLPVYESGEAVRTMSGEVEAAGIEPASADSPSPH